MQTEPPFLPQALFPCEPAEETWVREERFCRRLISALAKAEQYKEYRENRGGRRAGSKHEPLAYSTGSLPQGKA
jgi:hypothetical protein